MTMNDAVELRISELKARFIHGSFDYIDPAISWSQVVTTEFRQHTSKSYGVYIIRQREARVIIYIGKAGELDEEGRFKDQDLPKRLKNTREGVIPANRWFQALVKEHGPITLEYVIINSDTELPESVEAMLLRTFRADYGFLPVKNAR